MIGGFLKTLVLLGALQGFIVSGLLVASVRKRPNERTSRRLLAGIILLIAFACLDIYLEHCDVWTATEIGAILSAVLPLIIVMPVGPLFYFYIRSCEEPDFRISRRERHQFYPVVVDLFQHFAALCYILGLITGFLNTKHEYHFGVFLDDYNQYADIPRWVSLTIYLGLATRYMRKRGGGRGEASEAARGFLRVFVAFDIFWLLFLIPYELPRIGDALIARVDWYPLYVPLVAIIYYLGAKGYFITYRGENGRKGSIAIPEERLGRLVLDLRRAMEEERLWLNADLNLGRLAKHCGAAPKVLSAVLNQHMHTTFNDFVNGYRVSAVKERMQRPDRKELTIAGLAYECGFNSLPTFQRAFKASTGMSPKEYMVKSGFE